MQFDLCALAEGSWSRTTKVKGDSYPECRHFDWYICPGGSRTWKCGGLESYYCASWGCETYTRGWWKTTKGDLIEFIAPDKGDSKINMSFIEDGKKADWSKGKRRGIRLYIPGKNNPGLLMAVSQTLQPLTVQTIGPNQILDDQKAPSPEKGPIRTTPQPQPYTNSPTTQRTPIAWPGTGDRLLNLILGAYIALNYSDPTKTQGCWLCLVSSPPYYEGIAVTGNYSNQTSAPLSCTVLPQHKLTLSKVSGKGLCIGTVPQSHQVLCNLTQKVTSGFYYLAAPNGTYWACNTGLTPCISMTVLSQTSDYCMLVELWPKITYHEPEYIYNYFEGDDLEGNPYLLPLL